MSGVGESALGPVIDQRSLIFKIFQVLSPAFVNVFPLTRYSPFISGSISSRPPAGRVSSAIGKAFEKPNQESAFVGGLTLPSLVSEKLHSASLPLPEISITLSTNVVVSKLYSSLVTPSSVSLNDFRLPAALRARSVGCA